MSAIVKHEEKVKAQEVIDGIVILSTGEILSQQDAIRSDIKSLDQRVHANAVQCLIHASIHRDTSLMRRLLVDIIPEDQTGYFRQGIIAWMKVWSPMELGKTNGQYVIKLSGADEDGNEKPFLIDEANKNPFWSMVKQVAMLKPMFRDSLFSRISGSVTAFKNALANTDEFGRPKNPEKAFYAGKHREQMLEFFEMIDHQTDAFLSKFDDDTLEVTKAKANLRRVLGTDFEIVEKKAA